MPTMTQDHANDTVLEQIMRRSTTDKAFRARLIDEPASAIEEAVGVPLPKTMRIKFVVKDANVDRLVVLPDFHAPDAPVTDRELQVVQGEWCITSCTWSLNICVHTEGTPTCPTSQFCPR